jgi:hypothetical protein
MSCGSKSCSLESAICGATSLEFSKVHLHEEPGDLAIGALGKHRGVCVQAREMEAASYGKHTDTTWISTNYTASQFRPEGRVCGAFLGRIFISEHEGPDGAPLNESASE